jgi:hypothetical protein
LRADVLEDERFQALIVEAARSTIEFQALIGTVETGRGRRSIYMRGS